MTPELKIKVLALYTAPFNYHVGYIFDSKGNMVADEGDMEDMALRIRGWGRISYMDDPELLQDSVGETIAEALTEYWNKHGA